MINRPKRNLDDDSFDEAEEKIVSWDIWTNWIWNRKQTVIGGYLSILYHLLASSTISPKKWPFIQIDLRGQFYIYLYFRLRNLVFGLNHSFARFSLCWINFHTFYCSCTIFTSQLHSIFISCVLHYFLVHNRWRMCRIGAHHNVQCTCRLASLPVQLVSPFSDFLGLFKFLPEAI